MITGKQINDAIKDFLADENAFSKNSGVPPTLVSEAVKDALSSDRKVRTKIGLAVAYLLTSYAKMQTSGTPGSVLIGPDSVWGNPDGGRDAHVDFPIKMPSGFPAMEASPKGGPSLAGKASRSMRSKKSQVQKLLEDAESEFQELELEAESTEVEDSLSPEPAQPLDCCLLVRSVVALHDAGLVDDINFKQLVVRIAQICH